MKRPPARRGQGGFTLVELMVAMLIGLVVVAAAAAALMVSRIGFTTVDAASQLRDNGRFAADLIQRIAVQTGFRDAYFAALTQSARPASITGFNNAKVELTNPLASSSNRNSSEAGYGSDVLILRYQAARLYPVSNPGGGANTQTDKSMIDCAGNAPAAVPDFTNANAPTTLITSIFSVDVDLNGEPSLICTYADPTTGAWTQEKLVQGVENFQVLYGVDTVTANIAPASNLPAPNVPLSYLRADQMVVPGDAAGTAANWQRVRALRIGMVMRAAPNTIQGGTPSTAPTFYPLGITPSSATGTPGSAFSSTDDPGTIFTPTADTRLREVLTFTVHLRNDQGAP